MRLHVLQHDPVEDEGLIREWASARGCTLTRTRLFTEDEFPPASALDGLVVLGGPMNVYQYIEHPWLYREKTFLLDMMDAGLPMLGICLGAQLLADILGGTIRRNPDPEIGWFPVCFSDAALALPLLSGIPGELLAFHWHEDTFRLPRGAVHLASSDACRNQGFVAGDRVVGLQFHAEFSADTLAAMAPAVPAEWQRSPFVQTAAEIVGRPERVGACRAFLNQLLDNLFVRAGST